jgi:3D (Asp-Asp-Asp) domain-containing protein
MARLLFIGMVLIFLSGCAFLFPPKRIPRPQSKPKTILMETTGYCPCKKCCGWRRNLFFIPVIKRGFFSFFWGRHKKIGYTADGTKGKKGVVAADIRYYPFGTIMEIPGYGIGEVHDIGKDIQGKSRLDLFFKTHEKAMNWGNRKLPVYVWKKN